MLPEAFDHGGWLTGLMTVIGFLTAIFMGTIDEERHQRHLAGAAASTHMMVEVVAHEKRTGPLGE